MPKLITLKDFLLKLCGIRVFRYFLVGSVGAAIDLILFSIAVIHFKLPWFISSLISLVTATLVGYILSISFVFKSGVRYKVYQEILGVTIISFIAFTLHQWLMYVCIDLFSLPMIFSKILVIGMMFLLNYFGRSKIIFKV